MKLRTSLLLAACLCGLTVHAATYKGACSDDLRWTLDTESGEITFSGFGSIPDYDLKQTRPEWYLQRGEIKTVIIEEGIISIGANSFARCASLSELQLPSTLSCIGEGAFRECTELEEVNFPDFLKVIQNEAFNGCTLLDNIVLPIELTELGERVFHNTAASEDKKNWEKDILYISGWLTECRKPVSGTCKVRPNTIGIARAAFRHHAKLSGVTLPKTIRYIGEYAFDDTAFSGHPDNWVNGILYADDWCIMTNARRQARFKLQKDTRGIADGAFKQCRQMTGITLSPALVTIGNRAFQNCPELSTIAIPPTVRYIGNMAFHGCMQLLSVNIPQDVTLIGYGCFADCASLNRVNIPYGISHIDYGAFSNCTALRNIAIPGSVTILGMTAFANCISLREVELQEGTERLGELAFIHCSKLASVILPEGVTFLGDGLFEQCEWLDSLYIPSSVTTLGKGFIYGCPHIHSIVVSDGNDNYRSADGVLFSADMQRLLKFPPAYRDSTYRIPDGVKAVESHAFVNCKQLEFVEIPESLTSIGTRAFQGCARLQSLMFTENIRHIGEHAFAECEQLEITLPRQTRFDPQVLQADGVRLTFY
ncbi:MAG: leucine-rich repeat domain-containing protein [Paludibacteraceae bacterium]|nr:leucine-rich repeat domain-containing protein [Paludibacteraceae bacterium]MBR1480831.1 leucine-rich repeat domain-containing protein [Paludibacteraceae bacterium]